MRLKSFPHFAGIVALVKFVEKFYGAEIFSGVVPRTHPTPDPIFQQISYGRNLWVRPCSRRVLGIFRLSSGARTRSGPAGAGNSILGHHQGIQSAENVPPVVRELPGNFLIPFKIKGETLWACP